MTESIGDLAACYVQAGFHLIRIPLGEKGPRARGWNKPENLIISADEARRLRRCNVGLAHGPSGTCALDVDDFDGASIWLSERGIDLGALLDAPNAVQIRGRPGRAKLLYRRPSPQPFRSVVVKCLTDGHVLFELRCASADGATIQDVLPGSRHPDGHLYEWGGSGHYSALTNLPAQLYELWRLLVSRSPTGYSPEPESAYPPDLSHVLQHIESMRAHLGAATSHDHWITIGQAIHSATGGDARGQALWDAWSATAPNYDAAEIPRRWASFRAEGGRGMGTLLYHARGNGWHGAETIRPAVTMELNAHEWPEPAIPGSVATVPIEARCAPGALGAMCSAVAATTQTPEGLVVMSALPILALAAQGGWLVQPNPSPDYIESLALWSMTALASGERKSAVYGHLLGPVKSEETALRLARGAAVAANFAKRQAAEESIRRLKVEAGKADDDKARAELERRIAAEKTAMPAELHLPRLVVSDITAEATQRVLVENGGRLGIVSDKPGLLAVMSGAYSGHPLNDVFLQGHAGSSISAERQGRSAHIATALISIALAIQPGVLQRYAAERALRDSGLWARFLFCAPASGLGKRNVRATVSIPDDVRRRYTEVLKTLLAVSGGAAERKRLRFTAQAQEAWYEFAEEVEVMLRPGGVLGSLTDWGSKLPGQAARVAALFQLAVDPAAEQIECDNMERAARLCRALISHARHVSRLMATDEDEARALHLLRWIIEKEKREFTTSEAQKALEGTFRRVALLKAACGRLAQWQVLSPERERKNPGGPSTTYYEVNPKALSAGFFDLSTK